MKRYLPFVIIAAVLLAGFGAATWLFRSAQPQPTPTPAPVNTPLAVARPPIAGAKGLVFIEEYGDYQCPPCGVVHPMLKTMKGEFGQRLRLLFFHYPLVQAHKNALDAAHAAAAANLQGHFWGMHDVLYENQKVWSELDDIHPVVADYARQLKLDVERFKQDMDGPKVKAAVAADIQRADSMGVSSTPTIFIDGQPFPNEKLSVENLRKVIGQKLSVQP